MKRTFIHSSIFDSEWKRQKYSDILLRDIQEELCKNPTCGDIIQGTNGIRFFIIDIYAKNVDKFV